MLEGLIQAYFDAFGKGWTPRDGFDSRLLDSPRSHSALSSFKVLEGELRHDEKLDRVRYYRNRPQRLRKLRAADG